MFGFLNTLLLEGCSITLCCSIQWSPRCLSPHSQTSAPEPTQPNPTHTQKPAASRKVVYKKKQKSVHDNPKK